MAAAAGDAHPWPIYNARFRVVFPMLDADGDLVTGATTPDSEASQDQGAFADCTNEATEIATSSGMYYLDLVATELDTKCTALIIKSATAGMKTTPLVLYPKRFPVLRTGTAQAGAATTVTLDSGASAINDFYNGCYVNITNNSPANALGQARRITDYVGSTKVATVEAAWGTNPSSASTFEILLPGDVVQWNSFAGTEREPSVAGVPEVDVTQVAGTTQTAGDIIGDTNDIQTRLPAALVSGRMDSSVGAVAANAITAAGIADGAIDAATFAAGAIDAAAIAANAIGASEIADGAIDAATFAAGAIDAAAIAANAIGASEIADGAIDAATFAAGAIDAAAIAANAIGASEIADGAIDAATFAAGAIDAAAIAANAIGASELADGAIDRATFAADTGLQSVRSNTAQAGAAGTITLDASASATDDIYNDQWVYLTGGTGVGQSRLIVDYVGATKVASVSPNWATNPDSTSTFAILPFGRVDVGYWLGALVNALIAGRVDANAQVVGDKTGYSIASGGIASTAFAAGAIDAAAIAANAIGASEVADGTIDAATFAAGAIDATAIATGAIDADALAADAVDEIWDEAMVELSQAAPSATPAMRALLALLYMNARNAVTVTSTTKTFSNDAGTVVYKKALSDDGTTYTEAETVAGP